MSRVIHFEIAANDPEHVASFYTDVFGWTVEKWDGPEEYWMITTGPEDEAGINGGLMRTTDDLPGVRTVNTISVDSVDAFTERIVEHGGTVSMSKFAIEGMGYFAYCADPEGVLFGIMEFDPSATAEALPEKAVQAGES